MTNETQVPEEPETPNETTARPSWVRRYVGPVVLGVVLGVALLYVIGRLGAPAEPPQHGPEVQDESKLLALDPRLVMTVPELPDDVEEPAPSADPGSSNAATADGGMSVDLVELPPCDGGVEDADCLLSAVPRAWQLLVGSDPPAEGGPPVVTSQVGERLGWPVVSARAGLLVSFLVEEDGSVLLLYPTPEGDLPVVEAGALVQVPRHIDRAVLKWSAPGPRRVFALVGTTPFFPPFGEEVGRVVNYYQAGEDAARFFHGLRAHVYRDLSTGSGEWSIAEAVYEIEPASDP